MLVVGKKVGNSIHFATIQIIVEILLVAIMLLLQLHSSKSFSATASLTRKRYSRSASQVLATTGDLNVYFNRLHHLRSSLSILMANNLDIGGETPSTSNDSPDRQRLDRLFTDITNINGGTPINLNSPKQISTAIFGASANGTTSVTKKSLQQAAMGELNNVVDRERQQLAALILEYRTLASKHQHHQHQKAEDNRSDVSKLQSKPPTRIRQQASFSTLAEPLYESDDADLLDAATTSPLSSDTTITTTTTAMKESLTPSLPNSSTTTTYETMVDNLFKPKSKINPYWKDMLLQVSKPSARALISQLNPSCPMGYDPAAFPHHHYLIGRSNHGTAGSLDSTAVDDMGTTTSTTTTAGKKGTFLAFCRDQKIKYGDCIVLTRCGDFYETFGIDAIMLVEHCGLNAMAGKARAGCPIRNIQATLNCLTAQGFRVVVYEEAVDTDAATGPAQKSRLKTRMLAQIVSSASPTYLYDLALLPNAVDTFATSPASRPYVGIVSSASGYTYVEVSLEERNVRVSERLTFEAVACRLAAYPPADPLLLVPPSETTTFGSWTAPFLPSKSHHTRLRTKMIPPVLLVDPAPGLTDVERARRIVVSELLKVMKGEVDVVTGLPPAQVDDFVMVESNLNSGDSLSQHGIATNPLYVETATQLGLMSDRTIPSLVAYLVPDSAPAATRRFLRRWLLTPPPPQVASSMARIVSELKQNGPSLPPLSVPPIGKVLALLRAGQARAQVYGELLQALVATETVIDIFRSTSDIINSLMFAVEHESGMAADATSLANRCREARDAIERVISPLHHPNIYSRDAGNDDDDDRIQDFGGWLPRAFFERNESPWRGRVRPDAVRASYDLVNTSAKALAQAIATDFWGLDLTAADPKKARVESNEAKNPIVQDIFNNLLALKKVPVWAEGADDAHSKFFHPRDRNGKILRDRYTTSAVQDALANYVSACEQACRDVTVALSRLSRQLYEEGHIPAIVQAAHANLILSTASNHAAMSNVRGWNLADVGDSQLDPSFCATFTDLWPYWMDRSEAVANSFDLNGLFLLTAPNMSGKSTLMRSTAAAALLSVCGLCAPVGSGTQLRRFDNIFVRGASADVPTEQKSAFGAEMGDIAALFRCCTDKSLVFVDELGRGTSPKDGTCLAGAVMEAMAKAGMSGIFATHLHDILTLPLEGSQRIVKKRMAVKDSNIDEGRDDNMEPLQWTYRIEDGVCLDSMALVTAARFGLPDSILQRAASFAQLIPTTPPALSASSDDDDEDDEPSSWRPVTSNKSIRRSGASATNNPHSQLSQVVRIAEDVTSQPGSARHIPPGWSAPASTAGGSYVYILELGNDHDNDGDDTENRVEHQYPNADDTTIRHQPLRYYVGETDALQKRLVQHRAKGKSWSNASTVIIPAPNGKTQARAFESLIIQKLAKAGFALESTTDGRHVRSMGS